MRDEAADFGGAPDRVEHLIVEPVSPGEVAARRVGVERLEVGDIGRPGLERREEALADEQLPAAVDDRPDLGERELGMVLHAP